MLSWAVRNPFWPLIWVAAFRSAYYLIVYEVLGEKAKADFGALFALLAIQGIQGICLGGVGLALQGSLRDKNFWGYQILGIGNLLTAALPVSAYWLALPFKVVQVFSVPLISIVQAVWARIRQHYSFGRSHLRVIIAVIAMASCFGADDTTFPFNPWWMGFLALAVIPTFSEKFVKTFTRVLSEKEERVASLLRHPLTLGIGFQVTLGLIVFLGVTERTFQIPRLVWWTAGGLILASVTVWRDQVSRGLKVRHGENYARALWAEMCFAAIPNAVAGIVGLMIGPWLFPAQVAMPDWLSIFRLSFIAVPLLLSGIVIQTWVQKTKGGFRETSTRVVAGQAMVAVAGFARGHLSVDSNLVWLGVAISVLALFDQYIAFSEWRRGKDEKRKSK